MQDRAPSQPIRQVDLIFSDWRPLRHVDDPLHKDLSAVTRVGDCLFVACDETASIERLRWTGESFGDHVHIPLIDFFDLPGGPEGEMDIEGLTVAEGYLWIVGSHSCKRSKPKRSENGAAEALLRMERTDREPNRYFLGRVPLVEVAPRQFAPIRVDGERHAASLKLDPTKSPLIRWLRKDPLLAPFIDIPSKENGVDIEGIAVSGDRVWLGLRGPVLRGHAVVLDLVLKEVSPGRLKATRIDGKRRYRKHLIDTRGLGIRDMRLDGEDLLLLVGPTMSLEGPAHVMRWRKVAQDAAAGVVDGARIETILDLPYRYAADHPEGLELWPDEGGHDLLVIYDAPASDRLDPNRFAVRADVMRPVPVKTKAPRRKIIPAPHGRVVAARRRGSLPPGPA